MPRNQNIVSLGQQTNLFALKPSYTTSYRRCRAIFVARIHRLLQISQNTFQLCKVWPLPICYTVSTYCRLIYASKYILLASITHSITVYQVTWNSTETSILLFYVIRELPTTICRTLGFFESTTLVFITQQ